MFLKFKATLLILLLCFQYGCLGIIVKKPSFSLKNVSLTLQSAQKGEASLTLEIVNPNRFKLHFKSLEYRFSIAGRQAGAGLFSQPFHISPESAKEVTVPLAIEFESLSAPLKLLIRGQDIPYSIEGTLHVKILWSSIKVPFAKDDHISFFR